MVARLGAIAITLLSVSRFVVALTDQCSLDWYNSLTYQRFRVFSIVTDSDCNKCHDDRNCGYQIDADFVNELRDCINSAGKPWAMIHSSFIDNNLFQDCGIIVTNSTTGDFVYSGPSKKTKPPLPIALIAGCSVGLLILLAGLIAGGTVYYLKRKKQRELENDPFNIVQRGINNPHNDQYSEQAEELRAKKKKPVDLYEIPDVSDESPEPIAKKKPQKPKIQPLGKRPAPKPATSATSPTPTTDAVEGVVATNENNEGTETSAAAPSTDATTPIETSQTQNNYPELEATVEPPPLHPTSPSESPEQPINE